MDQSSSSRAVSYSVPQSIDHPSINNQQGEEGPAGPWISLVPGLNVFFLLLKPPCLRVQNTAVPACIPPARARAPASVKPVRGKLLLRATQHRVQPCAFEKINESRGRGFCCAAAISMGKWDPEMLCSTSVALRGALFQRSLAPRLIEVTPKGSPKPNSSPMFSVSFFFSPFLSTPFLEEKPLKLFFRKDSNVIWMNLMWSQGWLLMPLKPPAVAECWRVWDRSSNVAGKLVSKLNKGWAGGWGSLLPLPLCEFLGSRWTLWSLSSPGLCGSLGWGQGCVHGRRLL